LAFPVSESGGSERNKVRGEFAMAFLKAVNYSDDEIALLGDLSRIGADQVKALLNAKLEQIKLIEDIVRNPPDFKLLHQK
jgi:hypothetical protein